MKTDTQLRSDVEMELEWDPRFDARDIGVAVKGGVVTLSGEVRSYAERWAAQNAVQSVAGIKAVANEIEVVLVDSNHRSDADLAAAALNALDSHVAIPMADIKLTVSKGWITLSGHVPFWYQKQEAESTLRNLRGVTGIANDIVIKPAVSAVDVKTRIEDAFRRHAKLDADKIRVQVIGGTVTLEGEVKSWQERNDAEFAVWAAPGVTTVKDKLAIRA
jgi:osmotically-inducible protein OsmY